MLILFSMIVMRMSGMIWLNPIFGSSVLPSRVKTALILVFSLMLYMWSGGQMQHEPASLLEYGVMLLLELAMGAVMGFAMDLAVFTVRYASAIMDFTMGLSMAQVYDPASKMQITVTSEMQYALVILLFLAGNGHLRLVSVFFGSASAVPFGQVSLSPALCVAMLDIFRDAIVMGMQLAFPLIAMELVAEAAVGIMMRMIPQINVFAVNFQIKIIVGMLMLLFLFSPMAEKMEEIIEGLFINLNHLIALMQ